MLTKFGMTLFVSALFSLVSACGGKSGNTASSNSASSGVGSTTKDVALVQATGLTSQCYLEGLQSCAKGGGGAACVNLWCGNGPNVTGSNVDGICNNLGILQTCLGGGGGAACAQPSSNNCFPAYQDVINRRTPSTATLNTNDLVYCDKTGLDACVQNQQSIMSLDYYSCFQPTGANTTCSTTQGDYSWSCSLQSLENCYNTASANNVTSCSTSACTYLGSQSY